MTHGYPDWGRVSGKRTTYQLKDMGELAARLGSINTFDRRGDVIWMDDFEASTLKWAESGFEVGYGIALSTASARNGAQSLKITTGNAVDDWASASHHLPLPVYSNLAFEFSFALGENIQKLMMFTQMFMGDVCLFPVLQYLPQENRLEYRDVNGDDAILTSDLDLHEGDLLYHTWKLVFDLSTRMYVRAMVDDVTYDMSLYELRELDIGWQPFFTSRIVAYTETAASNYVYVDDVIVTQNEP